MVALLFVWDPLIDSEHYFVELKDVDLFAYSTELNEFYVQTLPVYFFVFKEFVFVHFFELTLAYYVCVIRRALRHEQFSQKEDLAENVEVHRCVLKGRYPQQRVKILRRISPISFILPLVEDQLKSVV